MSEITQKSGCYVSREFSTEAKMSSFLDSILKLCQGPQFPRTISTFRTKGRQVEVSNIDEIIASFSEANFVDCRINAYPKVTNYDCINLQAPTLVMCDLDLVKFRTERLLLETLDKTVDNIQKDIDGIPTVLFTGNGYHIYQPITLPVLEEESIFARFENPSTEFIRYAAQKWTNGKNDPANHPSVNSCLLRVPGSINSKNNKVVEVVQEWNGVAPTANRMLSNFYVNLAAQKMAHDSKKKEYYFQQKYMNKNYNHFGNRTTVDFSTNAIDGIGWIDHLLSGDGLADYRKLVIDLILAPYFVNIKQADFDTAFAEMTGWLDKCAKIRGLDFKAKYKVSSALKRSLKTGIRPMRMDTMRNSYGDMYDEIFSKESTNYKASNMQDTNVGDNTR